MDPRKCRATSLQSESIIWGKKENRKKSLWNDKRENKNLKWKERESLRLAFWHILHRNNNPCSNTRCAEMLSQLVPIIHSSPATPQNSTHSFILNKTKSPPSFLDFIIQFICNKIQRLPWKMQNKREISEFSVSQLAKIANCN